MRQACNVSYAIQAEGKDEVEFQKWESELNRPPAGWLGSRRRIRDRVDPGLLEMMSGGRS